MTVRGLRADWATALTAGSVAALSCGIIDVCMALLSKPRGFEQATALAPPILATAAVFVVAYLVLWRLLRPAVTRLRLDAPAAAATLAVFAAVVFTLTLLAGLHSQPFSPQLVFRAALILILAILMSAGTYGLGLRIAGDAALSRWAAALVAACPLLLFEVLLFEWLEVYMIDRVASVGSALAFVSLGAAQAATIAWARGRRWRATRVFAVFSLLLAVVPAAAAAAGSRGGSVRASEASASGEVQRIVLITVDTLRADAVSAYRAGAPHTTAIDALADDGVLFEHAVAPAPWTLPSLASILTGLEPAAHRTTGFAMSVPPSITTLAEYLSGRGYETAAFVHNDVLNPKNGLTQGFSEYRLLDEPWFADSVGMQMLQLFAPGTFPPRSWPSNDDQTHLVVNWLEANRERNFFLWIHYFDPHAPYTPPPQYRTGDLLPSIGPSFGGPKTDTQGYFVPTVPERQAIRSLYDGEVRYVDANIARVVAALKQLDLYDGSLIVFTSDHGEEFWEHGLFGHGQSLYEELLRVPLVVKLPGSAHRGRSNVAVTTASITPTILDVNGIHYDAGNVSAPSLLPLIDPAAGPYEQAPIVSDAQLLFDRRRAIFFDGFKYVVSTVDGREELFDLNADPHERHSLVDAGGETVATLRRLLQASTARADALRRRLGITDALAPTDQDTVRRLRALGYVK